MWKILKSTIMRHCLSMPDDARLDPAASEKKAGPICVSGHKLGIRECCNEAKSGN